MTGIDHDHPFVDGILPEINHPLWGYPHDYGKPHIFPLLTIIDHIITI